MKLLFAVFLAIAGVLPVIGSMTFVHPGSLNSKKELDFVKVQIRNGAQPWKGEFDRLMHSDSATRTPHGLVQVNSTNDDSRVARADAIAAYTQALLWYFTEDEAYARRAVAILDSWAALQAFTAGTEQDRLLAGWFGSVLAQAAEIMRGDPQWSVAQRENLQAMFKRALYPQLNTASFWNGNVDLTQIDAMMAIAVFNEDEAEFRAGLARLKTRNPAYFYLTSDGPLPRSIAGDGNNLQKFWHNPVKWIDGLTQETCRDNGHHAQFGLGSALHAAEIAWQQGVDVFTENQERYTAAMELMARQFLTGSMQGICRDETPNPDRYQMWEVGYNHYHHRAGVALPYTEKLLAEQIRERAERASCNLVYETLTHADLPGLGRQ